MDDALQQDLQGRLVVDESGAPVGRASQVLLDDTGTPAWIRVATGTMRQGWAVVPAAGAQVLGDSLRVPHAAGTIEQSSEVAAEEPLTPGHVGQLRRLYGLSGAEPGLADLRDSPESVLPDPGGPGRDEGPLTAATINPESGEHGRAPGESSGS